ncbi:MAG: SET domain-containing protein-lysine N-methyltransferase [Xanthomonadales bacterium]|nr:SET domain-containing protein-lysine N-methyltransferase [Xanthomonadales bacterium]
MRNRVSNPLVQVADSSIHGKGLFAARDIETGRYIGLYEGEETLQDGTHVLWVEQDDGEWLGYDGSNELRYLNHDASPNCEMDGQELYAARNIKAGEELTIDYGEWFEQ